MTVYYAGYVPVMREKKTQILFQLDLAGKPKELEIDGALELVSILKEGDELFLMMGSTNAAAAARLLEVVPLLRRGR